MTTIVIVGKSTEIFTLHVKQNVGQLINCLHQAAHTGLPVLDDLLEMLDYYGSPQNWRYLENGADMLVLYHEQISGTASEIPPPMKPLSNRQQQVLRYLSEGLTTRQIASRMQLHPGTVEFHIRSLKKRLGANTRAEFISKATANGLFRPAPSPK